MNKIFQLSRDIQDGKHYKFTRISIIQSLILPIFIMFVSCIFIEIFLFNFRYCYSKVIDLKKVKVSSKEFTDLVEFKTSGYKGLIELEKGKTGSFAIDSVKEKIYSLKLNFVGVYEGNVSFKYSDESYAEGLRGSSKYEITSDGEDCDYITFITSGKLKKINVYIENTGEDTLYFDYVTFNEPYFNFNYLRVTILYVIFLSVYFINKNKLWTVEIFKKDRLKKKITISLVILSILFSTFIYYAVTVESSDVLTKTPNDNYQYMTEYFSKGKVNILKDPPRELLFLKNPYDPSSRDGIDGILWDTAYYKGKYYSYFGVAPVLTLLLPVKVLTGSYLKTPFAVYIFTIFASISIYLLYNEIVKKWYKKTSALTYLIGGISILFASNLYWNIARPMVYDLAEISGITFLLLYILMLFKYDKAYNNKYLFLGSLCYSLAILSRPNFIFYIFIGLLFLYKGIKNKKELKDKIFISIYYFLPLILFGAFQMIYNYLRFNSVFNFGENYQLTVSDVRFNTFSISKIITGLYHYYIQKPVFSMTFPFIKIQTAQIVAFVQYYFQYPSMGLFAIPYYLILLLSIPIIKNITDTFKKKLLIMFIISAFVISIFDIIKGGIILRYSMDFSFIFMISSTIMWFELEGIFLKTKMSTWVLRVFVVVTIISSVMMIFLSFAGEDNLMKLNSPSIYHYLIRTFEFWR